MYRNDGGDVIQAALKKRLEDKGCEVVNDFDMRKCYVLNGSVFTENGFNLSGVDLLYHMNADEQTTYQNEILRALEASGVQIVNSWRSFSNSKDKFLANLMLSKNGIRVPKSAFIGADIDPQVILDMFALSGSVVVKPRGNHGGKGIIKLDKAELLKDFMQATHGHMGQHYMEEFIPFGQHDFRVEVFNGAAIGGYSRRLGGSSYKTNVSSGGEMVDLPPPQDCIDIAVKAADIMGITTTIVDLIKSDIDGQIYVLEVNPMMGIFVEQGCISRGKSFFSPNAQYCNDNLKIDLLTDYLSRVAYENLTRNQEKGSVLYLGTQP